MNDMLLEGRKKKAKVRVNLFKMTESRENFFKNVGIGLLEDEKS
jgi:hypothetical protein